MRWPSPVSCSLATCSLVCRFANGHDHDQRLLQSARDPDAQPGGSQEEPGLKITTSLLVRGSCGISRPFGDEKVLHTYLRDGKSTKRRRRLEADAKSLVALYQYGRLHGAVRLRWGFLDEQGYAIDEDEIQLARLVGRG